jgi:hypothetical protein
MQGPAIVLVARKADFRDLLNGPNIASFQFELAINIDVIPPEFERMSESRVAVEDSIRIIRALGYPLPTRLPDLGALMHALTESPRMPLEHVQAFVEQSRAL